MDKRDQGLEWAIIVDVVKIKNARRMKCRVVIIIQRNILVCIASKRHVEFNPFLIIVTIRVRFVSIRPQSKRNRRLSCFSFPIYVLYLDLW
jgi:hypothetical protein